MYIRYPWPVAANVNAGFVKVRVGVFNPYKPERVVGVDGIVDTGAIYTVVRRSILEELGIKPLWRKRFKALGRYVERDVDESGLLPAGGRRVAPVIFGEADDTVVVDLTALEISGLEVDAVKGTLKEAEPLPL